MGKKWWEGLPKDKGKPVLLGGQSSFWRTVPLSEIDQATGLLKCDGVPYCPVCNRTLDEVKQLTEKLREVNDHPEDISKRCG